MWVQLLIPRIEDGNNFGVSIQEETVAELRTVEGEAASYLDQISRCYRSVRSDLAHFEIVLYWGQHLSSEGVRFP